MDRTGISLIASTQSGISTSTPYLDITWEEVSYQAGWDEMKKIWSMLQWILSTFSIPWLDAVEFREFLGQDMSNLVPADKWVGLLSVGSFPNYLRKITIDVECNDHSRFKGLFEALKTLSLPAPVLPEATPGYILVNMDALAFARATPRVKYIDGEGKLGEEWGVWHWLD